MKKVQKNRFLYNETYKHGNLINDRAGCSLYMKIYENDIL